MSPILRSHKSIPSQTQIPSLSPPKARKVKAPSAPISPHTPSKTREKMSSSSSVRRSSRLASKSSDDVGNNDGDTNVGETEVRVCDPVEIDDVREESLVEGKNKRKLFDEWPQILNLYSGKRVSKTGLGDHLGMGKDDGNDVAFESNGLEGKRISSSKEDKGKNVVTCSGDDDGEKVLNLNGLGRRGVSSSSKEEKGKNVIASRDDEGGNYGVSLNDGVELERRRVSFSREEKGKGIMVDLNVVDVASEDEEYEDEVDDGSDNDDNRIDNENDRIENDYNRIDNERRQRYMEGFRNVARRNALRFAHFSLEQEEEGNGGGVPGREEEGGGDGEVVREDWPGPFSTALKIIRDRMNKEQGTFARVTVPEKLLWVPRKDRWPSRPLPPLLEELSMAVLATNIDAVSSLDCVPDVLRHKLTQLLCDSRRMNGEIFAHLLRGSPTEVRVKDCSWLTEEQFTESFKECETSRLTVLQLDQCGRCMPDYVLNTTLGRSCNSLPILTTLSLKGACRLSDIGLKEIVSSAPNLRSINLGQCSLLTSKGIEAIADSLGSVLRELYLDDCQGIETKLALPALKKLKSLELFSLAGFESVCDDFIKELMVALGHNMKEILLTDCVKLTDSSLRAIAESCPGLCALDLVNLHKLTDSGIGYLASGCLEIQTLKLCRNAFSDEAVAAFLETSGESLLELSLNNINKVARNTALSISKQSRKLVTLDLSWCRNLSDDALGLIVDSCPSLKVLKLFGCTQVTNTFLDGHSNAELEIIGLKMTPILKHLKAPDLLQGPLRYSSV